jgi:hypothetical protein
VNLYAMTYHPLINGNPVDRQMILDTLDKMPEILNWRASIGAIFLVSNQSSMVLSRALHLRIPDLLYVILPVGKGADGWADKDTWTFINDPKSA